MMKDIRKIEFCAGSREEFLPGFSEELAKIWLLLFEQAREQMESGKKYDKNDEKIKEMMIYAHEHYNRKITVEELAASAFLSERECFRAF